MEKRIAELEAKLSAHTRAIMSSQRTIEHEATLSGAGLHTGEPVDLVFKPAPPDSGLVFVRTDIDGHPTLRAHPDKLVNRPRRTAMAEGDIEVHTTEHLLAAATGLGIDNLIIELNAVEFRPVMVRPKTLSLRSETLVLLNKKLRARFLISKNQCRSARATPVSSPFRTRDSKSPIPLMIMAVPSMAHK